MFNDVDKLYNSSKDIASLRLQYRKEGIESIKPFTVDLTNFNKFYIAAFSDMHLGARGSDIEDIIHNLKEVLNIPNIVIISNGDMTNNAIVGSVSNPYKDNLNPGQSIDAATTLFQPFADKGKSLIGTTGNHEARSLQVVGLDPTELIFTALNKRGSFAPHFYTINVLFKDITGKKVVCSSISGYHGSKFGGASNAGSANMVANEQNILPYSDFYIVGHTHKNIYIPEMSNVVDPKTGHMVSRKKNLVVCNSYQRYGEYAANQGLAPSSNKNYLYEVCAIKNPDYQIAKKEGVYLPDIKFVVNRISFGELFTAEDQAKYSEFCKKLREINEKGRERLYVSKHNPVTQVEVLNKKSLELAQKYMVNEDGTPLYSSGSSNKGSDKPAGGREE